MGFEIALGGWKGHTVERELRKVVSARQRLLSLLQLLLVPGVDLAQKLALLVQQLLHRVLVIRAAELQELYPLNQAGRVRLSGGSVPGHGVGNYVGVWISQKKGREVPNPPGF